MKQIAETTNFIEAQIRDITGGLPVAVIESVKSNATVIAKYNNKEVPVSTNDKFEGGEVVPVTFESNEGTIHVGKALDFKQAEFIKTMIITNNYINTL